MDTLAKEEAPFTQLLHIPHYVIFNHQKVYILPPFLISKMAFMDVPKSIRLNGDVDKKAQIILRNYPLFYENLSHLVRCAIIKIYNQEVLGQKHRELSPDEQKIARMEVE